MTRTSVAGNSSVQVHASFDDLPEFCTEFFQQVAADADVFSTLPWLKHLAETSLEPHQRPRIYSLESRSGARMVLPMCSAVPTTSTLGPRRLTALANYYTPLFKPAICGTPSEVAHDLHVLVSAIALEQPAWHTIDLHPLELNSAIFDHLLATFRSVGMPVQRYFCFGNWYLDVAGRSYEEYSRSLPSNLQHLIARKSKPLEASNRLRIDIVTSEAAVEQGIAAYEQVYAESWKNAEPFPSFMSGLIRLCAKQGWLRLGIAYVDNQPAAAQLWMVHNQVASIYKLAYSEKYSKLSIGSILTSRLMRHVMDIDRVREVDYLSGDDAYKRDWMSHRRERWGIVAFNLRTLRGILLASKHLGWSYIKRAFSRPSPP